MISDRLSGGGKHLRQFAVRGPGTGRQRGEDLVHRLPVERARPRLLHTVREVTETDPVRGLPPPGPSDHGGTTPCRELHDVLAQASWRPGLAVLRPRETGSGVPVPGGHADVRVAGDQGKNLVTLVSREASVRREAELSTDLKCVRCQEPTDGGTAT